MPYLIFGVKGKPKIKNKKHKKKNSKDDVRGISQKPKPTSPQSTLLLLQSGSDHITLFSTTLHEAMPDSLNMSATTKELLKKVRMIVPPMLEKFHKGTFPVLITVGMLLTQAHQVNSVEWQSLEAVRGT